MSVEYIPQELKDVCNAGMRRRRILIFAPNAGHGFSFSIYWESTMKITILFGSPNKNGSTSILVDSFFKGATEGGHECEVLDICHMEIHPCIGCVSCGYEGPCVQQDDVEQIRESLLASDMMILATPL